MNRTILSTRLLIPMPRKNCVVRESLFRRLDKITDNRLTIIKGTPGSGKTTLLTSFIEKKTINTRWITLDSECNYIALFWDYVMKALSGLLDKTTGDFATFLQVNAGQNINEALKVLINSIEQTGDIVLVLDDFHLINNTELLNGFEYFLANIPPNVHVVLLTRERPGIYLAGYELHDELLYVDEQDLSLSDEEGVQFLKQTLALSMPDENLLELVHKAGGWIGGLQLMVASQTSKAAPKVTHTLNNALLYDYIATEIFDRLTPDEQEFLVLTSEPTYFNKTVVKYLLPDICYDTVLSGLLYQNLMIQCVDEEQGLFQYHHLFRDYLLDRFGKLGKEIKTLVYRKLATVFNELGDEDESLRHLFLLEDYSHAMPRILELPSGAIHYNYMGKVPVYEAIENFDFAFQKFFYHYYIYDYDTCTALYNTAMQCRAQDERYGALAGAPILYGGETFLISDDLISTQEIRDIEMYPLTRALILIKNAAFLFYKDRYTAALEAVNESLDNEKQASSDYIRYFSLTLKIQICEEMGLLERALAVKEQIHQLLEENTMLRHLHTPTFSLTVAGLYMKQMRLEEAGKILEDCVSVVTERGASLQLSYNYNHIEYLFLTGDVDRAVRLLNSLMATEAYQDILTVSPLLKHQYRAGAMTPAMQDQFVSACENKPKDTRVLNSRLLYARIQAAQGEQQRALSELDEVLRIARKQESFLKIVEAILLRLSVMIEYSHDLRKLTDLYKEALYYACENNIRLPFYMEADTVAVMHQQYSDKVLPEISKQERAFHAEIMKMCITKKNCILSEREQEIIRLIAVGVSNANVAEKLFITIPTVKTHISNIFRKLEAKSRMEAVSKARQMGLIT